jgi:DNA repair protein RadA/Sms
LGRCPGCNEWSSLVEELELRDRQPRLPSGTAGLAARVEPLVPVEVRAKARGGAGQPGAGEVGAASEGDPTSADGVEPRIATGLGEVDRVLGGGLVVGSMVLLGGEPGVGKSTLLLRLLDTVAGRRAAQPARRVLYVTGEESVSQVRLRASRMGVRSGTDLSVLAETNLERIVAAVDTVRPDLLAVDSIQTLQTDALDSIAGSVGQVRETAARLLAYAKATSTATIVVGHVTKDGSIAGPKTLEHMVDVVLYVEGEGGSAYRTLRAVKNRFGSTRELGVFEMRDEGLVEVANPSERFLAERPRGAPGSVIFPSAEGSRPILVEVQALVAGHPSGSARRSALGIDSGRLALLLAVLERRAGLDVGGYDVFVNVAGGVRLAEPAADLAVACAVASSLRGVPCPDDLVVFGEVGLAGEIRGVGHADLRLAEAARMGFRRLLLPEANRRAVDSARSLASSPLQDPCVRSIGDALAGLVGSA